MTVCPHCLGTGYMSRTIEPRTMVEGVRLSRTHAIIFAVLLEAKRPVHWTVFATHTNSINAKGDPYKVMLVHICNLRKQLVGTNYRIKSIFGEGYVLESADAESRKAA